MSEEPELALRHLYSYTGFNLCQTDLGSLRREMGQLHPGSGRPDGGVAGPSDDRRLHLVCPGNGQLVTGGTGCAGGANRQTHNNATEY